MHKILLPAKRFLLALTASAFTLLVFAGAPAPEEAVTTAAQRRIFRGEELIKSIRAFSYKTRFDNSSAIEIAVANRGGFFQEGLNWDTAGISQIEFTVKADEPGFWKFGYNTVVNGEKVTTPSNQNIISVIPDGEYHTIIIPLKADPRWQGTLTNWELAWTGDAGKIGLQCVNAVPESNLIPGAAELTANEAVILDNLLPRGEYQLRWEGGTCPGAEIKFYDSKLQELPNRAITLNPGETAMAFAAPETLMRGVLEIAANGEGYPVLTLEEWRLRFSPSLDWRGEWIWHQYDWGPFHASVWFEKEFELDEMPEEGLIATLADDVVHLYVNGNYLGLVNPFWTPGRFDVKKHLKMGKNRITCRVYNGTQNAGLVLNCYIKLPSQEIYIATDGSWLCDPESNLTESIPERIDQPVVTLGPPATTAPWANMIGYKYVGPSAKLTPVKLEAGKMTVKVGSLPVAPVDRLTFELVSNEGVTRNYTLPIAPSSQKWNIGDTLTITYPVPYVEEGDWKLSLADEFVAIEGSPVLMALTAAPRTPPELAQASFINIGQRPSILLNGKEYSPAFWHAVQTVRKGRLYELDLAAAAGFNNFRIPVDFLDIWKGENQYDFSEFDALIDYLLTVAPDAVFGMQIYAHMPEWWLKLNPDDTTAHYGDHKRFFDREKQALASKKWLTDAEAPLKALIDHIRSRQWADRVWGASLAENGNGEWFWGNIDSNRERSTAGYSPADLASFRNFLRGQYQDDAELAAAWGQPGLTFATAELPPPELGKQGRVGMLLSPQLDRQVIDWFKFRNSALAEAIQHFGKFFKEQVDNKWLFGVYYGYYLELADNDTLPLQVTGHNAFLKVAQSPSVDFFHAPARYTYRKTGMSDSLMQVWDTFNFHGKVLFAEQDIRTALGPHESLSMDQYVGRGSTANESVGHLNRAFGMALATGTACYWFDISLGAFYEKTMSDVLSEQFKVCRELPPVLGTTPVETAIVGDVDSIYYTRTANREGPFSGAIPGLLKHINELAVPFHCFTVQDMLDETITVPAHKFYIMLPTLELSAEERSALLARFDRENAAVVWLYAAGPCTPEAGPAAELCGDFLGLTMKMDTELKQPAMTTAAEFGSLTCVNYNRTAPWFLPVAGFKRIIGSDGAGNPLMVECNHDGGATHYFSTLTNLPMQLYAALMQQAGVHRFSDTIVDPMWIGNDVLFLHAKRGGKKAFNLPPNTRLRAIIGPFEGTLEDGESFTAIAGQTYGFAVESK